MRAARGTFPGSDITINFQEFTGPTRRPVSHRVEDPGGPIYLVGVTDFSMAIEKIQEFGGLIGTDQKSVSLAHDARQSWTRDPNGMLIMLSQGEFTAPE
jgi:predicted enzyme related to lactoylglutathione lyase